MANYKPTRGKIEIRGILIDLDTAKREQDSLKEAIAKAEFHQEELDSDVKYNRSAISHLFNPSTESYPLSVEITIEEEEGSVNTELFEEFNKRQLKDLLVFEGEILADDIPEMHTSSKRLVAFEVTD